MFLQVRADETLNHQIVVFVFIDRCPPSKHWIEIAMDLKELSFHMKNYRCDKDYMFRVRASNEYGISEPSMSATLFAKPGTQPTGHTALKGNWHSANIVRYVFYAEANTIKKNMFLFTGK